MNIFNKILGRDFDQTVRLGNPLCERPWPGGPITQTGPFLARMNAMSLMTGGRGFRQPKKGPKLSKGGTTRRQREASGKEIYAKNLKAEADFRTRASGQPGWGIAQINRAIERREHLKS